ncbi:MAG: hypothetical protein ACKO7Z_02805 [Cyanobacteriota bacterium]
MIAFLDASAVIYAVEGQPSWTEALKQHLRRLADEAAAGGLQLAISRLSWLECRRPFHAPRLGKGFNSQPTIGATGQAW